MNYFSRFAWNHSIFLYLWAIMQTVFKRTMENSTPRTKFCPVESSFIKAEALLDMDKKIFHQSIAIRHCFWIHSAVCPINILAQTHCSWYFLQQICIPTILDQGPCNWVPTHSVVPLFSCALVSTHAYSRDWGWISGPEKSVCWYNSQYKAN